MALTKQQVSKQDELEQHTLNLCPRLLVMQVESDRHGPDEPTRRYSAPFRNVTCRAEATDS
jgi:hypothetical protein